MRIVAPHLSEKWKQPVVIENRPGANTNIGTVVVTKAEPDGHTLLFTSDGTFIFNPLIYPSMPYSVSELAPVSLVATASFLFSVGSHVPAKSIASSSSSRRQKELSTTVRAGLPASSACRWSTSPFPVSSPKGARGRGAGRLLGDRRVRLSSTRLNMREDSAHKSVELRVLCLMYDQFIRARGANANNGELLFARTNCRKPRSWSELTSDSAPANASISPSGRTIHYGSN
jgi:hypothetical protein